MRTVAVTLTVVVFIAVLSATPNLGADHMAQQARQATGPVPSFSRDVAPILYSKCVTCHRPGEVAPMALVTFRDVRPRAALIRDKVVSRVMPPWHADPRYGTFRNNPSLSKREIDTVVKWVEGGALEGKPAELPPLPKFRDGWQIGNPDVVFQMPAEVQIPARGTLPYRYFEVPTNFAEDRWMQAGEVRPGDREHVHHIIVYVREPKRRARPNVVNIRGISPENRGREFRAQPTQTTPGNADSTLVNWAVGEDAPVYQPDTAKLIPAGSVLIFQVHYTTNGKPGTDRSRIGLIFARKQPTREIRTGMIMNTTFALPPGAPSYAVDAEAIFSENVKIWTLHPHMHLRGKDMTYTAIYPDGRQKILLRVPRYDFGWQADYWLAEPLLLPKASRLYVSAHFDNSAANRDNPDPRATVRWGDQTWEEMMIGFFTYTVENPVPTTSTRH